MDPQAVSTCRLFGLFTSFEDANTSMAPYNGGLPFPRRFTWNIAF
jgi:hypothetical protein